MNQTFCKWCSGMIFDACDHTACFKAYDRGFCSVDCMMCWDKYKDWQKEHNA